MNMEEEPRPAPSRTMAQSLTSEADCLQRVAVAIDPGRGNDSSTLCGYGLDHPERASRGAWGSNVPRPLVAAAADAAIQLRAAHRMLPGIIDEHESLPAHQKHLVLDEERRSRDLGREVLIDLDYSGIGDYDQRAAPALDEYRKRLGLTK